MVDGSKEDDSMLRVSFGHYINYSSAIVLTFFLTFCPLTSNVMAASKMFSHEVSPSTRASDHPTRLDKLQIPRNRSTSSLASSAVTSQKLAINTKQPMRLSFHEGAVSDLEAVPR